MAGGKKAAKKLTPEEQLEQALVPVEEQPYAVPENWCWTDIKSINYYSGSSVDPIKQPDKIFELYSVPSSANNYPEIISGSEIGSSKQSVKKNDVLLCKINPRINRVWKVSQYTENELLASSEWIIVRNVVIDSDYLRYCFSAQYFRKFMLSNVSGVGGSLMRAQPKFIKNYPVPIAPLPEQRRIVVLIESLFAKLDEAREKAQAVIDSFELRRSAVLHKAFSGELTEQWRKQHGKNVSDWHMICFDKTAEIKSNLVDPADYQEFPHIAPDNIEKKTGVLLDYHTIAEDGVKSGKHRFYAGQILYSKIRPYLSKVIMVDFDGLCSADMYPVDAKENAKYLWYYMLSDEFLRQASNTGSRSVLPKINQKELSKIIVHMTSPEEQQAVVLILDSIFEKERKAQKAAESVIDQIETMKKAILSRAFRGELGTNDPKEENAENLLLKIFREKDNTDHRIKDVEKDKIDTKTSQNFKSSLEETIYQFILNNPECTLSEMKNLSGNFSDINKALLYLKQNKKIQINNSKYRVIIQDEDSLSSIQ